MIVDGFGRAVFPHPYQSPAIPTPRRTIWLTFFSREHFSFQYGRNASRHSLYPTPLSKICPVTVGTPATKALRNLNSRRSIFKASASAS